MSDETTLRVLLVDDDEAVREPLVEFIQELGYECLAAADGMQAWQMFQSHRPDVIVSDWTMPKMSGLELCERTRALDDGGRYTYFIFMTAFSDKAHFLSGMAAGADDYIKKPVDVDELQARLASAERVVRVYRKLAEQNQLLRRDSDVSFRLARIDALTNLSNRLSLTEDLKSVWNRAIRYGHRYSLAICDIDEFKKHNDRYGHIAGDDVLREVASSIRDQVRQSDAVYRYGGEEFVIVLPEQDIDEAALAMDRVRRGVERLAIPTVNDRVITISVGVAELDIEIDVTIEDWMRRADAALYRAKTGGRNRTETAAAASSSPAATSRPSR